jgi:type I restriction enzyme S subunit
MDKVWQTKNLGEVCDFNRGLTYAKNDEADISENIVLRATNIDVDTNALDFSELKYIRDSFPVPANKKVQKDTILICTASGSKRHLGKVALIDKNYNYAFGGFMGQIKPKKGMDAKFLFYVLTSEIYKNFINELSCGVNINNLKWDDLRTFGIQFPSLATQQRIVRKLNEIFADIEKARQNTEKNLQNARELFESYLQSAFVNSGKGWERKRIADIVKVINGFSFDSKDFSSINTIKSIKITNVGVKEFVEESGNYLPGKYKDSYANYTVEEGNVVIALTRTIISAGLKVALIPKSYNGALLNQRVAALISDRKLINQRFLYYFLCTDGVKQYVITKVNTLMQPNLSINDLRDLFVPCPSLTIQKAIIAKLDVLSAKTKKLEAIYKQKLADLDELKKSVLKKAFEGEI